MIMITVPGSEYRFYCRTGDFGRIFRISDSYVYNKLLALMMGEGDLKLYKGKEESDPVFRRTAFLLYASMSSDIVKR